MSIRITDAALDVITTVDGAKNGTAGTNRGYGYKLFERCAIGDGTGTPTQGDTAMFNEVVRLPTASSGGFDEVEVSTLDTTNNLLIYDSTEYHVWNPTVAGNIREIGFFTSAGTMTYHDLVRTVPTDPNSTATTVPYDAGDQVQVILHRKIQHAWEEIARTINIAGLPGKDTLGNHDINEFFCTTTSSNYQIYMISNFWPIENASSPNLGAKTVTDVAVTRNSVGSGGSTVQGATDGTWSSYVNGSHERDLVTKFTTAEANAVNIYTLAQYAANMTSIIAWWAIDFVNPAFIVKDSNHELIVTTTLSWDRA